MGFIGDMLGMSAQSYGGVGLPQGVGPANYSDAINNLLQQSGRESTNVGSAFGQSQAASQQQLQFADALKARMEGKAGPSLAELQQAQGMQQAQQQAASLAAAQRGVNPAMAARLAAQQQAGLTGGAAQNAAMLRAQENALNTSAFGTALQGMRGQDTSQATQMLGAENAQLQGARQGAAALGALQNQQQQFTNQLATQRSGQNQGIAGGVVGGLASLAGSIAGGGVGAWSGGEIPRFSDGGLYDLADISNRAQKEASAMIEAMKPKQGKGGGGAGSYSKDLTGGTGQQPNLGIEGLSPPASGGPNLGVEGVSAMPSGPGLGLGDFSMFAAPAAVPAIAHGGEVGNDEKAKLFLNALNAKAGGKVPGKAIKEGDSPDNDTVPAMLSPGEIVIPRSIAKDPEAAKDFVQAIHDRHKEKGPKAKSYGDVLQAKKRISA